MITRRLSDLYQTGKLVSLTDGDGPDVQVWLHKLNPVDRETCLRRANAAKARFMIEADNEDSERFQAMYAQVREIPDRDSVVGVIVSEDIMKHRERVEAKLLNDEDTWGKDDYLQGLLDAWVGDDDNPGLAATFAEYPDDPEAVRVNTELTRFETEVGDQVRPYIEKLRRDLDDAPDDVIWRRGAHRMLEIRGNEAFNDEFDRQQLYFAVRDPEKRSERYFHSVHEIDDLDERVVIKLKTHYQNLTVSTTEGKDSRASQSSSNSSESTPEAETSQPSGQEAAVA